MSQEEMDKYAESLAADLYWAGEQWFRKVDPYHAHRPLWFALADEHKVAYREMATQLIDKDTAHGRA
jgi:glutamyl/glutaminyl-tRNA synthetase